MPNIDTNADSSFIVAKNARHPMVEAVLKSPFVPNDIELHGERDQSEHEQYGQNGPRCIVLTGPNMGGKSSYIRMVAVLAIMAQIGSFVPADKFDMGVIDAVYTRYEGI